MPETAERGTKPYYEDGTVTIYHGRAEDVLPELRVEVDMVFRLFPRYPGDEMSRGYVYVALIFLAMAAIGLIASWPR